MIRLTDSPSPPPPHTHAHTHQQGNGRPAQTTFKAVRYGQGGDAVFRAGDKASGSEANKKKALCCLI